MNYYLYLDEPEIESLYAQTIEKLNIPGKAKLEKAFSGRPSVLLRFKNMMNKLLRRTDVECSNNVTDSLVRPRISKHVLTIDRKLGDLITSVPKLGRPIFFDTLSDAIREAKRSRHKVFVSIHDKFEAPQFYPGSGGADDVNAQGYLILDKRRAGIYDSRDDYYRGPQMYVSAVANWSKLPRSARSMPYSTDASILLTDFGRFGFAGHDVPLHIFGTLTANTDYCQVKPYAIWF